MMKWNQQIQKVNDLPGRVQKNRENEKEKLILNI